LLDSRSDGRRVHTVERIAAEFGITCPLPTATLPNYLFSTLARI